MQTIVKRLSIFIFYDDVVDDLNLIKIREIFYKYNGYWKIRNVTYSYQHPSKFVTLEEPETHLLIYKLFIDVYYDDFRMFWNIYHLLDSVYIQISNMSLNERIHLKNHFVLGFVPFNSFFDEFIKPFIIEIKILEKGKVINIQGNECIVIVSLSDITADLP